MFARHVLFAAIAALLMQPGGATAAEPATLTGQRLPWHPLELTFAGPEADESGELNPFTDVVLHVKFRLDGSNPRGGDFVNRYGFFAADGRAADTGATGGDRWRVRVALPKPGRWSYRAVLLVNDEVRPLAGGQGAITIDPLPEEFVGDGRSLYRRGLLRAGSSRFPGVVPRSRYWVFGDGSRFLKAGVNSPETLLAYADFDGTTRDLRGDPPRPVRHEPIPLPSLVGGLHRYEAAAASWREGDPQWGKGETAGRGRGLVGMANELAELGGNSVTFLTMNVGGDGRNVWPWTDPWTFDRFDVSKLAQWNRVFEHFQRRGIVLHVYLQETENDHLLDGGALTDRGTLGPERMLYLRELIARFGHHPGLVWNLGEENLQSDAMRRATVTALHELDTYRHPIVMHNDHWSPRNLTETFDAAAELGYLDGTSLQDFHWADVHAHTLRYTDPANHGRRPQPGEVPRAAVPWGGRHPWAVYVDELGGAQNGLPTDADDPHHHVPRMFGLWANLMAGGAGVEWYFGWQNNSPQSDLSAESWQPRAEMLRQSRVAVDIVNGWPLEQMQPRDELTLAPHDFVLAAATFIASYQPIGLATRVDVGRNEGPFLIDWIDPLTGERHEGSDAFAYGPGLVATGDPPAIARQSGATDWLCTLSVGSSVVGPRDDGAIVLEAERGFPAAVPSPRSWYTLEKSGAIPTGPTGQPLEGFGEPTTWVRSIHSAAAKAGGNTYIRLLPDTRRSHDDRLVRGENFSPEPGKIAIRKYAVRIDEPGRYYVWARAFSVNTEDNGLHVGLDDTWPESGARMQWCEGKRQWTWGCAQRTEANHCGEPMQIWLDIDTPGVHEVAISMREDGFALDQLLLTRDRSYRPEGIEHASRPLRMTELPPIRSPRGDEDAGGEDTGN